MQTSKISWDYPFKHQFQRMRMAEVNFSLSRTVCLRLHVVVFCCHFDIHTQSYCTVLGTGRVKKLVFFYKTANISRLSSVMLHNTKHYRMASLFFKISFSENYFKQANQFKIHRVGHRVFFRSVRSVLKKERSVLFLSFCDLWDPKESSVLF